VDEFEAMDLLDCLDYTWGSAVVYLDDTTSKLLERPYGRVNRTKLKSKMIEACISHRVQFHQSKVGAEFLLPLLFPELPICLLACLYVM
jgi:lycopene beta-cyclase